MYRGPGYDSKQAESRSTACTQKLEEQTEHMLKEKEKTRS